MTSPYDNFTDWELGEITELENERELQLCWNGLHLYTSLADISIGEFGPRVFEAEPIGEIIKAEYKICCRAAKLIRELSKSDVTDKEWLDSFELYEAAEYKLYDE